MSHTYIYAASYLPTYLALIESIQSSRKSPAHNLNYFFGFDLLCKPPCVVSKVKPFLYFSLSSSPSPSPEGGHEVDHSSFSSSISETKELVIQWEMIVSDEDEYVFLDSLFFFDQARGS